MKLKGRRKSDNIVDLTKGNFAKDTAKQRIRLMMRNKTWGGPEQDVAIDYAQEARESIKTRAIKDRATERAKEIAKDKLRRQSGRDYRK